MAIIAFENKSRSSDQTLEEEQNIYFSRFNTCERIRSEREIPELTTVKEVVAGLKKKHYA